MSSNCKWPGCDRDLDNENLVCPHHGDKIKNLGGIGGAIAAFGGAVYSQKDKIQDLIEKVADQANKHS